MPSFPKEDLQKRLTEEQYRVTQEKGTEAPFSGEYDKVFTPGIYSCIVCTHPLFVSENKFDAGCGWPSFDQAAEKSAVIEHEDNSHGMRRIEVTCSNCGAHLGHVFPDGPKRTTGLRYCINSSSLKLNLELSSTPKPIATTQKFPIDPSQNQTKSKQK